MISETHHGFVCANAGIDLSNVEAGTAALLPEDPDRSARRLRDVFVHRYGVTCGVIISDTFGRTWRRGVTDIALGSAGIRPILDLRGTNDALGRELAVTEVALVDEVAAAADLVMGKSAGIAAAIVRGVDPARLTDPADPGWWAFTYAGVMLDPSEVLHISAGNRSGEILGQGVIAAVGAF